MLTQDILKPLKISLISRRSFLGQTPIFIIAALLCLALLPNTSSPTTKAEDSATFKQRLARIDGPGALLLGVGILALLLPLEIGGQKVPWTHPLLFILLAVGVILIVAFFYFESYWAKEPIFPPRLLRQENVALSYLIMAAQSAAQLGVCPPSRVFDFC